MKRNAREETDRGGVDARASWGAAVLRPYMILARIDFGDFKALGREKRRACGCTEVWLIVVTGYTPRYIFQECGTCRKWKGCESTENRSAQRSMVQWFAATLF